MRHGATKPHLLPTPDPQADCYTAVAARVAAPPDCAENKIKSMVQYSITERALRTRKWSWAFSFSRQRGNPCKWFFVLLFSLSMAQRNVDSSTHGLPCLNAGGLRVGAGGQRKTRTSDLGPSGSNPRWFSSISSAVCDTRRARVVTHSYSTVGSIAYRIYRCTPQSKPPSLISLGLVVQ